MTPISQALQFLTNSGKTAVGDIGQGLLALFPGLQKNIVSPISDRDSFMADPALQYYYAHQENNDPQSFMPQSQNKQSPTPTPIATATPTQGVMPTPQILAAKVAALTNASAGVPSTTPNDPSKLFPEFTTSKVPDSLSTLIHNSAVNAGVDPNVLASLLFSEHGFQTTPGINRNTDGSYDRGIAQINSAAHPEVSDQQALDPNFAVPYAAKLLATHVKNFNGDYNRGIAAYNVGEGGASNPNTFNNQGKAYLNKVAHGLTPDLIKQLGIKSSN